MQTPIAMLPQGKLPSFYQISTLPNASTTLGMNAEYCVTLMYTEFVRECTTRKNIDYLGVLRLQIRPANELVKLYDLMNNQ